MLRLAATLPNSMTEICLVRFGIQARRWTALRYVRRLAKSVENASCAAQTTNIGLLHSEILKFAWNHYGVIQYWSSFESLEAWTRQPPHSEWWGDLIQRVRTKGDVGIYHEAYVVPKERIESIFIDCERVGLATFGLTNDASGPKTTARDRLGLRK